MFARQAAAGLGLLSTLQTEARILLDRYLSPLPLRHLATGLACAVTCIVAACASPDASAITHPVSPSHLAQSVTSDVWRRVDGDNHFLLAQGESSAPAEIDGDSARRLAEAFWRHVGWSLAKGVSVDRGAPVHASDLQPCSRVFYARSAYESIPSQVPPVVAKVLGPHWLVGLCYGSTEEVLVSVSAHAIDIRESTRPNTFAHVGDGDFFVMGVPVGAQIPVPPEEVAVAVAEAVGRRVAAVPVLVSRPFPQDAVTAVWELTLDAPVTVTSYASQKSRLVSTLLAGALNGWQTIAYAVGRTDVLDNRLNQETQVFQGPRAPSNAYALTRRPDIARALELVHLEAR
jgi:hypothetical protein